MDDLGVLRWFVEATQCKSFTLAAKKYGVTSSAVSQGIARLERELGGRLFNRTTRQLNLTNEGQAFLKKVQDGLASLEEASAVIHDAKNEPSGMIRISIPSSLGKDGLLPTLAEFLDKYPKVNLDVCFHDGAVDLVKQGVDLALVWRGIRSLNCVTRRLGHTLLVLVASPGYLKRHGIPLTPTDLPNHDWISVRHASGVFDIELEWRGTNRKSIKPPMQEGVQRYKIAQPTPQNSGEIPHFRGDKDSLIYLSKSRITISEQNVTSLDAALLGMGIAVLSISLVQRYFLSGELKLLLPDYRVVCDNEMFVEYPKRDYLPSRTRKLIDHLIDRYPPKFMPLCDPDRLLRYAARPLKSNGPKSSSTKKTPKARLA